MGRLLAIVPAALLSWGCASTPVQRPVSAPVQAMVSEPVQTLAPREGDMERSRPVEITAHRGASADAPENTMASFRRAAEEGADRIELDVRLTSDEQLVVLHDATLDRTTDGEGVVAERAYADLSGLDAGHWKAVDFRGEPVPRLDEVLTWSAGRIPLNVELKAARGVEATRALARAAVELIHAAGVETETQISSFDPVVAAEAASRCPRCEVALLWNGRSSPGPLQALEGLMGVRALHLPLGALTPELVEAARARGLSVRVYTVNTLEGLERAVELGVDGVITDLPGEVRRWLGGR